MVKLKSHKIKHTPLCDLLSVLVKHWFPVFHHRIFKSKHLPVAFYLKVKVVVQICLDCPVHFMQFLFALTQYHHVIHVSHVMFCMEFLLDVVVKCFQVKIAEPL